MQRVEIELPSKFIFETDLAIRINDINYGGHLGHDAFLPITHEARVRFLKKYGYSEMDIEGVGIIMSDAAIVYRSETFYGEIVTVHLGIKEFGKYGFNIVYLLENKQKKVEIGRVKTGILFYDYNNRKLTRTPKNFRKLFE